MTFEEFCRKHKVTKAERRRLLMYLIAVRTAEMLERMGG